MKKLFNHIILLLCIIIVISSCGPSNQASITTKPESIQQAIDSSNWVFTPLQAIPQYGRTRQVGSDFSVQFKNNKFIVYLPYYGRSTSGADVYSGKGPLDFTTADFTNDTQHPKKDEWNIIVKPNDHSEVQQMNFTFYSNGRASLDVILVNHSGMRYNGAVTPGN